MPEKIILDCDPGHDDAIAMLLAHGSPDIELLGNIAADRLSIVSFLVRHDGRYLHHNFVVAVLNDLFGIQSRGGCSCAGPYGLRLLGIDDERSARLDEEVALGCEGIKPGWVRVNFNYFISDTVFDYVVRAVQLVGGVSPDREVPHLRDVAGNRRHAGRQIGIVTTRLQIPRLGLIDPVDADVEVAELQPTPASAGVIVVGRTGDIGQRRGARANEVDLAAEGNEQLIVAG